jgi:hypothetical protein
MPTDVETRRSVLMEAALAMCPHCRGSKGHTPVPVKVEERWWHRFTHGNGWNKCDAGPIWNLLSALKKQEKQP